MAGIIAAAAAAAACALAMLALLAPQPHPGSQEVWCPNNQQMRWDTQGPYLRFWCVDQKGRIVP